MRNTDRFLACQQSRGGAPWTNHCGASWHATGPGNMARRRITGGASLHASGRGAAPAAAAWRCETTGTARPRRPPRRRTAHSSRRARPRIRRRRACRRCRRGRLCGCAGMCALPASDPPRRMCAPSADPPARTVPALETPRLRACHKMITGDQTPRALPRRFTSGLNTFTTIAVSAAWISMVRNDELHYPKTV